MLRIEAQSIMAVSYKKFIPFLGSFYREKVKVPPRHHYAVSEHGSGGMMLLMPCWAPSLYAGVKMVTVYPDNARINKDTIQGTYLLMSASDGELLCTLDGPSLTSVRTAAVSALACSILSDVKARVLMIMGTGRMCPELVKAHIAVRQYDEVLIWGRDSRKAQKRCEELKTYHSGVRTITDVNEGLKVADVVSTATYSEKPIVHGRQLKKSVHVDLVGSFQPHTREADDDVMRNAFICVDDYHALEESGDLILPINNGVINRKDVNADLPRMVSPGFEVGDAQKTVFKSVGNARSDLALAVFLYENRD